MTTITRRRLQAVPAPVPGVVLGIDQSYSGFAVCAIGESGRHDVVRGSFGPDKYGTGIDRLAAIGSWLTEVVKSCSPVLQICMEGYAPGAKFGREIAGELGATVKLTLRTHPMLRSPVCYPTVVSPSSVKQFTTGKGNSRKEDMKLHIFKRWGAEFRTNDEADSYALAQIAAALQWDRELTAYQSAVIQKLKRNTERRE